MSRPWPRSPLAALDVAFGHLSREPRPLTVDCRPFPDLPDACVPVRVLRRLLTDPRRPVPRASRDAVWRDILRRARQGEAGWQVAAAGMAVPGLTRVAGLLARGWRGDTADLDAELLTGFLDRMRTLDLDSDRLCGKLIDAAERAAKRSREYDSHEMFVRVDGARSAPPREPWGHPDWVLARAVAAAYLNEEEYRLIADTRLDGIPLEEVAARIGIELHLAVSWRRTAERRLCSAIVSGALDHVEVGAAALRRAQARLDRAA